MLLSPPSGSLLPSPPELFSNSSSYSVALLSTMVVMLALARHHPRPRSPRRTGRSQQNTSAPERFAETRAHKGVPLLVMAFRSQAHEVAPSTPVLDMAHSFLHSSWACYRSP